MAERRIKLKSILSPKIPNKSLEIVKVVPTKECNRIESRLVKRYDLLQIKNDQTNSNKSKNIPIIASTTNLKSRIVDRTNLSNHWFGVEENYSIQNNDGSKKQITNMKYVQFNNNDEPLEPIQFANSFRQLAQVILFGFTQILIIQTDREQKQLIAHRHEHIKDDINAFNLKHYMMKKYGLSYR